MTHGVVEKEATGLGHFCRDGANM
ncbi:unnamed protein product [Ectocarpus sp. CCAP 1310/34]|nr:unnamed protein product [Ectocarpus sp. CCAP 1310/34]